MGVLRVEAAVYNPMIKPTDFSTNITNPYFALPVGLEINYEGETGDGLETIEITIPGDTKMIMGVKTLVYHDKVWIDGKMHEETYDYLAQDKEGNVWYFGEDVDNYDVAGKKVINHKGSWHAGVDGALPGIWMYANPVARINKEYREEYFKGEAEDMAKVVSINETVKVPFGTFKNCVKTLNWNPLDSSVPQENKYYCKDAGGVVLETNTDGERIELIGRETNEEGVDEADDVGGTEDADEAGDMDEADDMDAPVKGNEGNGGNGYIVSMQMKIVALLQQLLALLRK